MWTSQRLFQGMFAMNFALTLGFGIAETFFTVFLSSLGARGATLGIALGFYAAAKILFAPLMGAMADRWGKKPVVLLSLALLCSTSLLYLFVTDLWAVVVLRVLQGVGFAMYRPAVLAAVGELSPDRRRGTALGTFDISFYAAIGSAPVLGGLVKDHWSFNGIFLLLFALCVLACLLALLFVPRTLPASQSPPSCATRPQPGLAHLFHCGRQVFAGLLAYIFGRSCGIIIFASFLPVLLISKLRLSGAEIGLIMASTTLITALILRPMGRLADRVSRRLLVVVGGSAVSLLYCLIPLADSFTHMYLLGIGIGIFSGVAQPASSSLLFEEGGRLGSGLAFGVFNTMLNLGFVIGSLLGAVLLNAVGTGAVFYGAGIVGMLAVGVFSVLQDCG